MDPIIVGIIGIVVLLVLIIIGMPIGFVMCLVGFGGYAYLTSFKAALGMLKMVPFEACSSYTLSVVPLFILMGYFAFYSGLSRDLFNVFYRWLGFVPGGLAIASIGGCAGFASICGASPATAATMGTIVIPEMKKYKYDMGLATGSVAAGGTLGILIPPSVGFILYGVISENSIRELFVAGIVPGLLLASLFMLTIYIIAKINPEKGPAGPKFSLKEKVEALKGVWGIVLLFVGVIGGMMFGLFTPTEAAAIGAFGALLFMVFRGQCTFENLRNCLFDTGRTTAMVFIIMIGAFIFGYFLAITRIPATLTEVISALPLPPTVIMIGIIALYLVLGCIMDAIGMILLTIPIFYPVVISLGFDPIWFGVLVVVIMEQALITPPVGLNVYIIHGVAKDVPLETIFKGVLPFWIVMLFFIAILLVFPDIALFLPSITR
ncbi:MAG: C4-dicarboxylate ABC transporter permease [Gracilibacter sp. BRH_c7a]|nr:MAG: C4-dicarboxylate ABC transporter permease [Gracilibacter sp. BRH_c7a]